MKRKTLTETFKSVPPSSPTDALVEIGKSLDAVVDAVEASMGKTQRMLRLAVVLVLVSGALNVWSSRESSDGVDRRAAEVFEAVRAVADIQAAQTEAHVASVEAEAVEAVEADPLIASTGAEVGKARRVEAVAKARKAQAVAKKAKARIVAVKPDPELLKQIQPEPAPSASKAKK